MCRKDFAIQDSCPLLLDEIGASENSVIYLSCCMLAPVVICMREETKQVPPLRRKEKKARIVNMKFFVLLIQLISA